MCISDSLDFTLSSPEFVMLSQQVFPVSLLFKTMQTFFQQFSIIIFHFDFKRLCLRKQLSFFHHLQFSQCYFSHSLIFFLNYGAQKVKYTDFGKKLFINLYLKSFNSKQGLDFFDYCTSSLQANLNQLDLRLEFHYQSLFELFLIHHLPLD